MEYSKEENEEYYNALIEMTETKGWELFVKDYTNDKNEIARFILDECKDSDTYFEAKGKYSMLEKICMYKEVTKQTYDYIIAEYEENEEHEE